MQLKLPTDLSPEFASQFSTFEFFTERPEVLITQIPSPKGIAPEALAFSAEVIHGEHSDADRGIGRLVFCRDTKQPDGWDGDSRIILYCKSPVDEQMGGDPVMDELSWNWLLDSLRQRAAAFHNEAGTSTRIISTGHGAMFAQPQHSEIEIRASWAPSNGDLRPHLEAFQDLICLLSGLPPMLEGMPNPS